MTTSHRQRETRRGARALVVAVVAAGALLTLGATGAAAAPARIDRATGTCWKDVVNDWLQHQPNVLGSYPIACYTQAIQHLEAYPDIQQYSNAPDDIHRALLAAIRNNRGDGGNNGGGAIGPSYGGPGGGADGPSGGPGAGGGAVPSSDRSIVTRLFSAVGPGDAQSIPLPLLVLAGLAVLLLLTAAGTWIAKRLQTRRMTAAPVQVRSPRG